MTTRYVPSPFLIPADAFRNGSVFACAAAESGAAMWWNGVNTELFRNWLFQHGVLAL